MLQYYQCNEILHTVILGRSIRKKARTSSSLCWDVDQSSRVLGNAMYFGTQYAQTLLEWRHE